MYESQHYIYSHLNLGMKTNSHHSPSFNRPKDKDFTCEFCFKGFKSEYTLSKHWAVCGVPCRFCGVMKQSINGFRAHLGNEHGVTNWKDHIRTGPRAPKARHNPPQPKPQILYSSPPTTKSTKSIPTPPPLQPMPNATPPPPTALPILASSPPTSLPVISPSPPTGLPVISPSPPVAQPKQIRRFFCRICEARFDDEKT